MSGSDHQLRDACVAALLNLHSDADAEYPSSDWSVFQHEIGSADSEVPMTGELPLPPRIGSPVEPSENR